MPRFVLRPTDGSAAAGRVAELRAALEELTLEGGAVEVDLNRLGKGLARVTACVAALFVEAGLPSVRMEAAVKALDLRTAKSALERFVSGP